MGVRAGDGLRRFSTANRTQDRRTAIVLLNQLSRRNRKVLLLRAVERLSAEEVGRRLGLSAERVRVQQYHALTQLRVPARESVAGSGQDAHVRRRGSVA